MSTSLAVSEVNSIIPAALSLCVPTYRRRKELEECIESILESARHGDHRIELLVSDNASPDDTWDYLVALRARRPEILIYRQEENIGAERNIYGLAERALGEWLWVLGDDDRLEPEAIGQVLSCLERGPPALILNYSVWSADFGRLINRKRFSSSLPELYETSDELMRQFGIEAGYCSGLVFRKDRFLSADRSRYDAFAPFGFALLYAFYSGARTASGFQYLKAPVVMNRRANSSGFDWYKYFVCGTTMVLDKLGTEGYSKKSIRSTKAAVISRFVLRDVLVRRRDEVNTSHIFKITYHAYRSFPLFWVSVVPALAAPAWLLRSAHLLLKVRRRVGRLLSRTLDASRNFGRT